MEEEKLIILFVFYVGLQKCMQPTFSHVAFMKPALSLQNPFTFMFEFHSNLYTEAVQVFLNKLQMDSDSHLLPSTFY